MLNVNVAFQHGDEAPFLVRGHRISITFFFRLSILFYAMMERSSGGLAVPLPVGTWKKDVAVSEGEANSNRNVGY